MRNHIRISRPQRTSRITQRAPRVSAERPQLARAQPPSVERNVSVTARPPVSRTIQRMPHAELPATEPGPDPYVDYARHLTAGGGVLICYKGVDGSKLTSSRKPCRPLPAIAACRSRWTVTDTCSNRTIIAKQWTQLRLLCSDDPAKRLKIIDILFLSNIAVWRTLLDLLQAAGWSSLVARKAHNLEVNGSNPFPATNRPCA